MHGLEGFCCVALVVKATFKSRLNAIAGFEDFTGLLPLACADLSTPWAAVPLFLAGVLAPVPRIFCKNGGGMDYPSFHVAGDTADPALWWPSMSPTQGEWGL